MTAANTSLAIDSNVFRAPDFINYLILHKDQLEVHLPTIVQLEVGYYYLAKGNTWEQFLEDIAKFNGLFIDWSTFQNEDVVINSINARQDLPFHLHFRDFIIGTQCEALGLFLVTNNQKHFRWVSKINIFTPEEFISSMEEE